MTKRREKKRVEGWGCEDGGEGREIVSEGNVEEGGRRVGT